MDSFTRHIVSWYPGVHVDAVAVAERCEPERVRSARARAGRSTELGLVVGGTVTPGRGHVEGERGPVQLSFAGPVSITPVVRRSRS